MKVTPKSIRFELVKKGLVRPHYPKITQTPGHAIAVRRVDDRPATRVVPVLRLVKG